MAQLDLDTFEDVIEAVGVLISDAEATAALDAMPRNHMRAYSLSFSACCGSRTLPSRCAHVWKLQRVGLR